MTAFNFCRLNALISTKSSKWITLVDFFHLVQQQRSFSSLTPSPPLPPFLSHFSSLFSTPLSSLPHFSLLTLTGRGRWPPTYYKMFLLLPGSYFSPHSHSNCWVSTLWFCILWFGAVQIKRNFKSQKVGSESCYRFECNQLCSVFCSCCCGAATIQ